MTLASTTLVYRARPSLPARVVLRSIILSACGAEWRKGLANRCFCVHNRLTNQILLSRTGKQLVHNFERARLTLASTSVALCIGPGWNVWSETGHYSRVPWSMRAVACRRVRKDTFVSVPTLSPSAPHALRIIERGTTCGERGSSSVDYGEWNVIVCNFVTLSQKRDVIVRHSQRKQLDTQTFQARTQVIEKVGYMHWCKQTWLTYRGVWGYAPPGKF